MMMEACCRAIVPERKPENHALTLAIQITFRDPPRMTRTEDSPIGYRPEVMIPSMPSAAKGRVEAAITHRGGTVETKSFRTNCESIVLNKRLCEASVMDSPRSRHEDTTVAPQR